MENAQNAEKINRKAYWRAGGGREENVCPSYAALQFAVHFLHDFFAYRTNSQMNRISFPNGRTTMRWRAFQSLLPLLMLGGSMVFAQDDPQQRSRPMNRAVLGVAIDNRASTGQNGIMVADVMLNGPAAKAGIKAGDAIIKIDNQDIRDYDSLTQVVSKHKPGDKITVHIKQGDQSKDVSVTLVAEPTREQEPARSNESSYYRGQPPRRPFERDQGTRGGMPPMLGIQMAPLSPEMKQRTGVTEDKGVVIADVMPGSPAEHAGLKRDDVVVSIQGKAVNGPEDVINSVRQSQIGQEITVSLMRGKDKKDVKVRLEPPRMEGMMQAGGFGGPPDMQRMEQRINQLEHRIAELEQKLKEKK
jgi:membrane-associated protease RseP (regulator of RpoE activity)